MSIADKTGQSESITDVWRALRLFTNRQKLIKLFVSYINEEPPRETILFFYGDGGNGKSLLLHYLRENFCKRFKRGNWEWLKNDFHNEEFIAQIKAATENLLPTPFSAIDFGLKTTNDERPQDSFDGLLMLRRQLATSLIRFPLFDFACVWHLHKTDKLSKERLKDLFPTEEIDFISEMVNAASGTASGAIAKVIIGIIGKHTKGNFTLWLQKRGLDETRVAEVQQMDANTDLIEHLPDFFAEDLNAAMQQPNAPERIILFFDTHESFWGHQRTMPEATYLRQDEWLRRLLCKLELGSGIVAVMAGRESPNSDSKRESKRRWTDATRSNIPEEFVDAHLVGHLSPADADNFLQRAGVTDKVFRVSLIKYAEVEHDEVHPLYLGLLVDIVLAAKRQNKELSAADFHQQPQTNLKAQELINRLLSYIDADTRNAVSALAACRSFDVKIFNLLGDSLKFHATDAAFEILLSFSFVWQAERRGTGWYRIHELLRRLFEKNDKPNLAKAHHVLEAYHRQRNADGDEQAIAEAIYHASRIDINRSVDEWAMVFSWMLESSRYQICRALLEVRREMLIDDNYQLGVVSELEGRFHFELSYYTEAKQEFDEAIDAYDRTLELAPDYVSALGNKGVVLKSRGDLEAGLARHNDAFQSYKDAVEAFDRVLELAPDYVAALINKGLVLQSRGGLEAGLNRHNDALQSYKDAVKAYERALELAPDDVAALNNKGSVLQSRGDLEAGLARHNDAFQSYKDAVEAYERVLELAPDDVAAYVAALGNKGGVLKSRGGLEAGLNRHNDAFQSYKDAVEAYERVLELAPDYVFALNSKGLVLKSRGGLEAGLARHNDAFQSYKDAVKAYERALELAPDYVSALNSKGVVLQSRGDLEAGLNRHNDAFQSYKDAVEAYERALELAPDYVSALSNKGVVLLGRGIWRNLLGQINAACQDWTLALTEYKRSLEIAPDDKQVQNLRQIIENLIEEHCR